MDSASPLEPAAAKQADEWARRLPDPPTRYWKSPWGLEDDESPPARDTFFPPTDDSVWWYGAQMHLEDFLQHNCVFYNLLSGRSCHSDSYMTGVAYQNLEAALDLLQETYAPTAEEMQRHARAWLGNPNMQPPLRLVAVTVQRRWPL